MAQALINFLQGEEGLPMHERESATIFSTVNRHPETGNR